MTMTIIILIITMNDRLVEHQREQRMGQDALVLMIYRRQMRRRRRRYWVKPWLSRRPILGQYDTLFQELDRESQGDYMGFIRLDRNLFHEILQRVAPRICKSDRYRAPLEPGLKLVITLRHLATGASYKSLEYNFRVSSSAICKFVPEVCKAIYNEYRQEMFAMPQDQDQWRDVAKQYGSRWNFHHCCGAIDGKHVEIKKTAHSGSEYYNYKGYFSIILLAVVDADYRFIWCCAGAPGSASDAGVFNGSRLKEALEKETLQLPDPDPLPGDDKDLPYFLVGDDAFGLRKYMMKPYSCRFLEVPERIFNYRLSRARRVVENVFGILAHRWRCLLNCMQQEPPNAICIVEGCITLHNILRTRLPCLQLAEVDREDALGNVTPGVWRDTANMQDADLDAIGGRPNDEGKTIRNYLREYYNSDVGRVPWQERILDLQGR